MGYFGQWTPLGIISWHVPTLSFTRSELCRKKITTSSIPPWWHKRYMQHHFLVKVRLRNDEQDKVNIASSWFLVSSQLYFFALFLPVFLLMTNVSGASKQYEKITLGNRFVNPSMIGDMVIHKLGKPKSIQHRIFYSLGERFRQKNKWLINITVKHY